MTVSLSSFLDDLLKERNEAMMTDTTTSSSSCITNPPCTKVVIVDDNAQLTQKNRIQNSLSFASSSCSGSHLSSRWCSQPALQTHSSSKNVPSPSVFMGRRSSYGANAAWDDVRVRLPSSIDLWMASSSGSSMNCLSQPHNFSKGSSKSTSDLSAPKVPQRGKLSPYLAHKPSVIVDRDRPLGLAPKLARNYSSESEGGERSTKLRSALGSMAPSSSSTSSSSSSSSDSRKRSTLSSSKNHKSSKLNNNNHKGLRSRDALTMPRRSI